MQEFDEKFGYVMRDVYGDGHITDCSDEIKSFFNLHTRKLIEAVGEEIDKMSHSLHTAFHTDYSETQILQSRLEGYNAAISDVSLKLKEIINSLK